MNPEVICIGQALVDCITRGTEENSHKKNVYRAKSISLSTGGDALNESIILSHLGHRVKLICGLGEDLAGQLVLDAAEKNGVDVSGIEKASYLQTPVANLMVKEDGRRSSINSEATMLTGYVPKESALKGAKILSLASLFRAPLDQKETIISLIRAAKAQGMIVCADTKMPTYRTIALEDIREVLPLVDYIFPNENEAAYYTGKNSFLEMARYIKGLGVKNVIVKTGVEGCCVCGETEQFAMPALSVKAVDSTGAGDNFVAGFLSGILRGWNLWKCCEYGTACGAVSVQAIGATTGVQSRESVESKWAFK